MPKNKAELEEDTTNYLNVLPEELWLKILSYLKEPKDVLSASEVCKTFNNVAQDESLWRTMNKQFDVNYTEPKGAKNNFIQFYNDPGRIIERNMLKIEKSLNELLSKIDWNSAEEESLAAKVARLGYLTLDLQGAAILRIVEQSLNKELKNAKLLFDHISSSTFSSGVDQGNDANIFEGIEPGIPLQGLFIKLYKKCELNQFIQIASACYEFALNSECPHALDRNLFLMLYAFVNSLESENKDNKRSANEDESELEGYSSSSCSRRKRVRRS